MDYATFKTWFLASIWRTNDTVVSNNFDTIVQMAEQEMDQRTRHWHRRLQTIDIAPESEDYDLTTNVTDFSAMLSLSDQGGSSAYTKGKDFQAVPVNRLYNIRAKTSSDAIYPYYALDRNSSGTKYLRLVGPFSAADPGDLKMSYRIAIPDFASDDASWLESEYLNVFQYCLGKHCALFVREDERINLYSGLFEEQYGVADISDAHTLQTGGSPLGMAPHHHVP